MKRSVSVVLKQAIELFVQDVKAQKVGVIIAIMYFFITRIIIPISCPLVWISGFPCPACGLTRAFQAVLAGHFYRAAALHFFIYPIIVLALVYGIERYILRREAKYLTWMAIVVTVFLLIYYLYRMITVFPGEPPMSFYYNNLLQRLMR